LIRELAFLAEQDNLAAVSELPQADGDLRAGLPGADDDHALRHGRDVAWPAVRRNMGSALRWPSCAI
jgi:hypothetical protein